MASSLVRRAFKKVRRMFRTSRLYVRHRSSSTSIYHCCVPKTASQWIRGIVRDSSVYRYSGLFYAPPGRYAHSGHYEDSTSLTAVRSEFSLPGGRIVGPLYMGFKAFQSLQKPAQYKAFFVTRDPRDLVVSWYFSMKLSHQLLNDTIVEWRERLNSLPEEQGLCYAIQTMSEDLDLFGALDSWQQANAEDPRCRVFRFEDLISSRKLEVFEDLFTHCDIPIPRKKLQRLLTAHSFESLSGRKRGQEDTSSHLRKGQPGDWHNHFTPPVKEVFDATVGDLVERLGYSRE